MSEIRVNSIKNEAGSGAVELTHGATIPSGASLSGAGGLNVTGVVTATSFSGPLTGDVTGTASNATTLADGANITTGTISDDRLPDLISSNVHVISGVSTFANVSANSIVGALTGDVTGTATTATIANALQGTPNIEVGVITAVSAEFSGSVTIGGTLTYEDVKNVDSVGVVTANIGIDVVAGGIDVTAGGINVQAGILTAVTISAGDYTGTGNVNAANVSASSSVTAANFYGNLTGIADTANRLSNAANITTGTISDDRLPATITSDITGNAATATTATYVTYVGSWTLGADGGNSYYTFTGQGFDGTEQNPEITVLRGQRYRFINNMNAHPFQLETVAGVALTSGDGVSGDNPLQEGTQFWDVRMDEASELQYVCTSHAAMKGRIHVVNAGIGASTDVNTSGIITASEFVGPLTGTASTALSLATVGATGTDLTLSGVATATGFVGGLTGNVTGNASGLTDGGYNLNTSGIITATGGFIGAASTTPVVITHSAGVLTFTVAGIGSTSFALA